MGPILLRLTTAAARTSTSISQHRRLSILLLALFISVMAFGATRHIIGWDASAILPVFLAAAWLWAVGLVFGRIGWGALGQGLQLIALFAMLVLSAAWASDVLAVVSLPYSDEYLARADDWLGFRWPSMISRLRSHTQILDLLCSAYASLTWQPIVLIPALCISGRATEAWRFLSAWSIAMACTLAIFPFFPAVGGYVHFQIPRDAFPGIRLEEAWHYSVLLEQLRNGRLTVMNNAALGGMITMPSFHAAGAVLLGWGFFVLRAFRWPFLLLNGAMLVSAVPIGGHYLVDVLAGAFIALASIAMTSGVIRPKRSLQDMAPEPLSRPSIGLGGIAIFCAEQ
jgi:membrane-associated phospholipid phosphatase